MTTIGTRAPGIALTGPVAWQRTSAVGTELVFPGTAGAGGTAVVTGADPYTLDWRAGLDDDSAVTEFAASCKGAGGTRTLEMRRTGDGWVTTAEGLGEAGQAPAELDPSALILLAGSPIFLFWAVRHLGLTVGSGPVDVTVIRVAVPSLTISTGPITCHLVSANRLRVTGDGPAGTYELDDSGMVTYQPGQLRQVR